MQQTLREEGQKETKMKKTITMAAVAAFLSLSTQAQAFSLSTPFSNFVRDIAQLASNVVGGSNVGRNNYTMMDYVGPMPRNPSARSAWYARLNSAQQAERFYVDTVLGQGTYNKYYKGSNPNYQPGSPPCHGSGCNGG